MRNDARYNWPPGFLLMSDRTRRLVRRIIWNSYFTVYTRARISKRGDATRGDATQPTAECYPGRCPVSKVQFFLVNVEWPFLKPRFSEDLPGNRYDNTGSGRCTSGRMRESFCVKRGSFQRRPFHGRFTRGRVNSSATPTMSTRGKRPRNFSRRNAATGTSRREMKLLRVECNQARIDITINETR